MQINILNEFTVRMKEGFDQATMTLWLVAYGKPDRDTPSHDYTSFLRALALFCKSEGWLLESEDDEIWKDVS